MKSGFILTEVVRATDAAVGAGTFHSLFARILRVEAEHIGYPSNFTIYDSDDSKSLIKLLIKESNLNTDAYSVNNVRQRISSAKSNLITTSGKSRKKSGRTRVVVRKSRSSRP